MKAAGELPVMPFEDAAEFERWLAVHHATAPGVWLRLAKKSAPLRSVSYAEAVEVALCYGWIDSLARRLDEHSYVQKFTPRGARSLWSKINRDRVAALAAAGRMQPAGLAAVEQARADGRWARAYDSPRTAVVPEDLKLALAAAPAAAAFFAGLDGANRYAVLFRVQTARTAAVRARRIAALVEMLARGEKVHP